MTQDNSNVKITPEKAFELLASLAPESACLTPPRLWDLAAGMAATPEEGSHLGDCPKCRQRLDKWRELERARERDKPRPVQPPVPAGWFVMPALALYGKMGDEEGEEEQSEIALSVSREWLPGSHRHINVPGVEVEYPLFSDERVYLRMTRAAPPHNPMLFSIVVTDAHGKLWPLCGMWFWVPSDTMYYAALPIPGDVAPQTGLDIVEESYREYPSASSFAAAAMDAAALESAFAASRPIVNTFHFPEHLLASAWHQWAQSIAVEEAPEAMRNVLRRIRNEEPQGHAFRSAF